MVSIAIDTSISASIIGTDIHALDAATATALALVLLRSYTMPTGSLHDLLIDTSSGPDSIL
jgi:hypothetical protein